MKTAIFPGTFDPFTLGHASVVRRGLRLFDRIIIAVGINDAKQTMFTLDERLTQIKSCFKNEPRIEVRSYDGMTVDFARKENAGFILRGVRSLGDFEYERLISDVNQKISDIDTVFLFTEPEYSSIQSNVVRELLKYNQDISHFVPADIIELLKK
ncbi:MAG: pantetheine-phosphate adenylyltransferase [Bacteroidales bacterium]|nr:pantetheine-phosphate adenylyltransferase [Bacteroidales bacterium]